MHEAIFNINSAKDYAFDPTELAIHSILRHEVNFIPNCGCIFNKTVPFDNMVCFIDEDNLMSYVSLVFGKNLHPEASRKNIHMNQKWTTNTITKKKRLVYAKLKSTYLFS